MASNENINEIKFSDVNYPKSLAIISNPPKVLYIRGNLDLSKPAAAIVGARICSDYGKQAASNIAQNLARAGVIIVSGMAPGIDTLAHTEAVRQAKPTIAVLGSGIDEKSLYPQTNLDLSRKIIDNGGCLISEYPQGTSGAKFTFPQRNRIIAALSQVVIVIEAKEKSGSLITAAWAKKFNKPVFAIPGSIYSQTSRGANWLIKNGANLLQSADDVLKLLGINSTEKNKKTNIKHSGDESAILKVLELGARDINRIIIESKLPAHIVLSSLPVLEIQGVIKDLGNGTYCLN